MKFSFVALLPLLLLLSTIIIVVVAAAPQQCTDADLQHEFGLCDPVSNTMPALAYYKKTCSLPAETTMNLPKTVPCQAWCPAGQYMSPVSDNCEKCRAGTYSAGPDIRFPSLESKRGIVSWSTRCVPDPCDKWHEEIGHDGSVTFHSGNQSIGVRKKSPYAKYRDWSKNQQDESVTTVLTLLVTIDQLDGAEFRFSYRLESEPYFDGLVIFTNGTVHHGAKWWSDTASQTKAYGLTEQNAPFFASGVNEDYSSHKLDLPYGTTEIRFIYRKDATQANQGNDDVYGLDRAFIRDITVVNARAGSTYCTPCKPGQYSPKGAHKCLSCPENHFTNISGSASCLKCPSGGRHYAPPGSSYCQTKLECVIEDYVAMHTACEYDDSSSPTSKSKRTRYWMLPPDALCYETSTTNKPKNATVDCAVCPFGGYRDATTHECKRCQPGTTASKDGKHPCQPCPAGTFGTPSARFDTGFDSLAIGSTYPDPRYFKSECFGECADCTDTDESGTGIGDGICTTKNKAFVLTSLKDSDADNTFVAIRSSTANGESYHSELTYEFNTSETGATVTMSYFFAYENLMPPTQLSLLDPEIRLFAFFDTYGDSIPLKMAAGGRTGGTQTITFPAVEGAGKHTFNLHLHKNPFLVRPANRRLSLYITSFIVDGDMRGSAASCQSCPKGHSCLKQSTSPIKCSKGTHSPNPGAVMCETCSGNTVATLEGSTQCSECYVGSTANHNHSWCDMQCRIQTAKHGIWDFNRAKGHVFGPAPTWASSISTANADEYEVHRYFFTLCDHVPPQLCPYRHGKQIQSSVMCQRITDNISYSLGDTRELVIEGYDNSTNSNRVTLMIQHGDYCHSTRKPRATNVSLVCDSTMGTGTLGEFTFLGEAPNCHYNFHLTSALACRDCNAGDYESIEGDCSDAGHQTITYLKRRNVNCFGGQVPADTSIRCTRCNTDAYHVVWSVCNEETQLETRIVELKEDYVGCYDNGTAMRQYLDSLPSVTTRPCQHSFSARILPYAVIIVILFALSLIMCLIQLQRKHRNLRQKYDRLAVDSHGGISMEHQGGGTSAADTDHHNINAPSASAVDNSSGGAHVEIVGANNNNNHTSTSFAEDEDIENEALDVHPAVVAQPPRTVTPDADVL